MFGCGIVNPVLSGLVLSTSPDGQEGLAVGVRDARRATPVSRWGWRCWVLYPELGARDTERRGG